MKRLNTGLFLMILVGSMAYAQPQPPKEGPWEKRREMPTKRHEQMETIRIWKMTEYMELTEEQGQRFFPRLREHDKKVFKLIHEQEELMKEYENKCESEDFKPDSKDVEKLIKKMAETEVKIARLKEEFIRSLDDILTAEQQLKYILFEPRFRRKVMDEIRQHRMD